MPHPPLTPPIPPSYLCPNPHCLICQLAMVHSKPSYKDAVMKLTHRPNSSQSPRMTMRPRRSSPLPSLSPTPPSLKMEETLMEEVTVNLEEEADKMLAEVLRSMSTHMSLPPVPRCSPRLAAAQRGTPPPPPVTPQLLHPMSRSLTHCPSPRQCTIGVQTKSSTEAAPPTQPRTQKAMVVANFNGINLATTHTTVTLSLSP